MICRIPVQNKALCRSSRVSCISYISGCDQRSVRRSVLSNLNELDDHTQQIINVVCVKSGVTVDICIGLSLIRDLRR